MTDHHSLSRLDLNLLVTLDAILTERGVTKAAERLRVSQPTVSAALARLRTHFSDPILARQGNSYVLTPFATRLSAHTEAVLDGARRVFESQAEFRPEHSTREFSIYCSDYGVVTVGSVVSRLAAAEAPGVRFRFLLHNQSVVEDASHQLRSVDGIIIPHGHVTELPFLDLWRDGWMAVVASNNSAVGGSLTMQNVAELPWVMTYQSRSAYTPAARQMQQLGVEPRVEAILESFLSVGAFVAGTDRIGLIQTALAAELLPNDKLRVLPLPFEATPLTNALWWHPSRTHDLEHIWMRGALTRASRMVSASVGEPDASSFHGEQRR